jgi:hypothetical protein
MVFANQELSPMPPRNAVHPLVQSGMLLIGAAGVLAGVAWAHMRSLAQTYGVICGAGSNFTEHCPACSAGVLLFASGVIAIVLARADGPAVQQARAIRSA